MEHLMNELVSRSIVRERERELARSASWRRDGRRVLSRGQGPRPPRRRPGGTAVVAHA